MKILYIVSTLRRTGPTTQLYNIINHLADGKFSPLILTLSPEPRNSALPQFQKLKVPVYSLGLSRPAGFILGPSRLKRFISKHSPDLIHTNGIRADMLAANYLETSKRIATIRSYPYHDYLMSYGKLQGTFLAWRHLCALKRIECPVTCSLSGATLIKRKCGLELEVIHNGVDDIVFSPPSAEEKLQVRKNLGLPVKPRIFAFVGDLIKRKRPITLIRAFLSSKASDNNILCIIGDGPLLRWCQQVAAGSTSVLFTGHLVNIHEYLKAVDFFISTSVSEGLPNAVVEALATGLPVCLSDIGPHSEILQFNTRAGRIATVKDVGEIANAIDQLICDDYDEMSNAAVDIIKKHLNAKNMSLKYQWLYEKLLNGHH